MVQTSLVFRFLTSGFSYIRDFQRWECPITGLVQISNTHLYLYLCTTFDIYPQTISLTLILKKKSTINFNRFQSQFVTINNLCSNKLFYMLCIVFDFGSTPDKKKYLVTLFSVDLHQIGNIFLHILLKASMNFRNLKTVQFPKSLVFRHSGSNFRQVWIPAVRILDINSNSIFLSFLDLQSTSEYGTSSMSRRLF